MWRASQLRVLGLDGNSLGRSFANTFAQNGKSLFVIYLAADNEKQLPRELILNNICPKPGSSIRLLGADEPLRWECTDGNVRIQIPDALQKAAPCAYAWSFELLLP